MRAKTRISKYQINSLYHDKRMSQDHVATGLHVSRAYVALLMKKYGIPRRSRSEASSGKYNHFFGKKLTDATKLKISARNACSQRGKNRSQ